MDVDTTQHAVPPIVERDRAEVLASPAPLDTGEEHGVHVEGLTKEYQGGKRGRDQVLALHDISLTVRKGEFLVLLGPSGCGKSTLLRSIAGLETPQHGTIRIGEQVVFDGDSKTNLSPDRRPMSMIFQSYALWPHMTATENVAYPLQRRGVDKKKVADTVADMLDRLGLAALATRLPAEMSGGQQQRLALARALVGGSQVVLFDEPLSNVDAVVRERLRLEMLRMQRELGFTAIYVTHDQDEAMQLADRIAVMVDGKIRQIASPEQMYVDPADADVARFIGQSNRCDVAVTEIGAGRLRGQSVLGPLECRWNKDARREDPAVGDSVVAFGRPSDFWITRADDAGRSDIADVNAWDATVLAVRFHGTHIEYVVGIGEIELRCWRGAPVTETLSVGEKVRVSIAPEKLLAVRKA